MRAHGERRGRAREMREAQRGRPLTTTVSIPNAHVSPLIRDKITNVLLAYVLVEYCYCI